MQQFLSKVERPAQYIGGEHNSIIKDWQQAPVHMAFCFPDTYEIGMSHLGLRVLYEAVNNHSPHLLERCFTPQEDLRSLLLAEDAPLCTLESGRALGDFEVLGFTLQYELSYTNILDMLHLAKVPQLAAARGEADPLVIAGGPCAYNPEPLVDFIDIFCIGEGEKQLTQLLDLIAEGKAAGWTRAQLLHEAVTVEGVYVPSLYVPEYNDSGDFKALKPTCAPKVVRKALVRDLNAAPFPCAALLPHTEVVHDRLTLEIMRGCGRGCRFCQAGIIYRPLREKEPQLLLEQAAQLAESTGYEDMGLMSLSSADYTQISPLMQTLLAEHEQQGMGVSLPSLRVDAISVGLANQAGSVRKSGLTFAPEAGSQRLRDVINKGVTDEDIFTACKAAFSQGYTTIKLYFMIGLPYESMSDIAAIADLCREILQLYRKHKPDYVKKPVRISLGVASFVPKAHTPFQWHAQDSQKLLQQKQDFLRQQIRPMKQVQLKHHDTVGSMLEAAFARGDRRLGAVLLRAWQLGCRADGWSEHFKPDLWRQAFAECDIEPEYYAERAFAFGEPLPWNIISTGVSEQWLWQENDKARQGALTEDCRGGTCTGCGVCDDLDCQVVLAPPLPEQRQQKPTGAAVPQPGPEQQIRWRVRLSVQGPAVWLSHLDLLSALEKSLRRAQVPMAFSQGFNPHMLISWGPAHPVGLASSGEYLDLHMAAEPPADWQQALNAQLPPGLQVVAVGRIEQTTPALMKVIDLADYRLVFAAGLDEAALAARCAEFLAAASWPFERVSPKGRKTIDLRPAIVSLSCAGREVRYRCRLGAGATPKPGELAAVLAEGTVLETLERLAMYIGAQEPLPKEVE